MHPPCMSSCQSRPAHGAGDRYNRRAAVLETSPNPVQDVALSALNVRIKAHPKSGLDGVHGSLRLSFLGGIGQFAATQNVEGSCLSPFPYGWCNPMYTSISQTKEVLAHKERGNRGTCCSHRPQPSTECQDRRRAVGQRVPLSR